MSGNVWPHVISAHNKQLVVNAICHQNNRVAVNDIVIATGLSEAVVSNTLNQIGAETKANLEVTAQGQLLYSFMPGFQYLYMGRGVKQVLHSAFFVVFHFVFYVIKVCFGLALILSSVAIFLGFTVWTLLAGSIGGDERATLETVSSNWNVFEHLAFHDLLHFGTGKQNLKSDDGSRGLLLDAFTFLFGGPSPNQEHDNQKWWLIAQVIRQANTAIVSEQLAPYTGQTRDREFGVMEVLSRFNGYPQVTDSGNIVYLFPDIKTNGGVPACEPSQRVPSFLEEKLSQSPLPKEVMTRIIGLVGLNFSGSLFLVWLCFQTAVPVLHRLWLPSLLYSSLFIMLPGLRSVYLQLLNWRARKRNQYRRQCAETLASPTKELRARLWEAYLIGTTPGQSGQDDVIFTTAKDSLEQQFDNTVEGFDNSSTSP